MPSDEFPKINLNELKKAKAMFRRDFAEETEEKEETEETSEASTPVLKKAEIISEVDSMPVTQIEGDKLEELQSKGETTVRGVDLNGREMQAGEQIILQDQDLVGHLVVFDSYTNKDRSSIKVRLSKPE